MSRLPRPTITGTLRVSDTVSQVMIGAQPTPSDLEVQVRAVQAGHAAAFDAYAAEQTAILRAALQQQHAWLAGQHAMLPRHTCPLYQLCRLSDPAVLAAVLEGGDVTS